MPPPPSRSICSKCTSRFQWHRTLSTTTTRHSIAPESPRFINVPESLQTPEAPKPPVKGILPIPRQLFPPGKEYKTSNEYIQQTAPRATKSKAVAKGDGADRVMWQQRMADNRRANLTEGMRELLRRKDESDRAMNIRSLAKSERHERLSTQPDRLDETLTRPSVHNSVARILANDPTLTPSRSSRSTPNRHVAREARKSAQRKALLHTLYTHARSFIVTEEQMNEALDKAFGTDENPVFWNGSGNSIWSTGKEPAGSQDMLDRDRVALSGRGAGKEVESVAQKRMRRIAEEFTGGRIVVQQ